MKRQGKRKKPANAAATPKGMSIDTILEHLADLKDIATSLQTTRDDPEPTRSRVAACEAATDILTALQDEGIKDPEQVRDFVHDYNSLAKQYQKIHQKYEEPTKPERIGGKFGYKKLCPDCHREILPRSDAPHCWFCGKRLDWGK